MCKICPAAALRKHVNRADGVLVLLPHLDLRVGLSRADDPLPLSVAPSSRSTAAGPQRERGALPQHTAACAHCQLSLSSVHSPLEGANNWETHCQLIDWGAHQVVLQNRLVCDFCCCLKTPEEREVPFSAHKAPPSLHLHTHQPLTVNNDDTSLRVFFLC